YYPVKVEYYKELIRLLRENERFEEIAFWADRALVVYDWLLKAPPIKGELQVWLGEARRAMGGDAFSAGDEEKGFELWDKAEEILILAMDDPRTSYKPHYELGQIYEARGDMALNAGNTEESVQWYEKAKERYVDAFRLKDRVLPSEAPFNYAFLLLGRIYDKLGDTDRALEYYRRMLSEGLYSKNTVPYQAARQRIYELTGVWEGEPSDIGSDIEQ
ncbi:MAG TPA: DUF2225 domain-containing protein, partial [Firmicutes bacterium]|nr:DUF2225 domain-containing protein [Bacillota bacterium]